MNRSNSNWSFYWGPNLRQKVTAHEASTGHWKGQYPWPFGRDLNSTVIRRDVESDRLIRIRLGYVCNPRSLKEGTEMSRPVATAALSPLSGRIPVNII